MKTLVIAEKPSVAQDIVRALTPLAGKFEKHEEHFENEKYVVTSAVGHLLEIQAPEEFDVKRGKWSFAHLPVIPPHFDLAPIDKAKTRLNAVVRLIKRKDVSEIINACDAGREGELIFRLIVQYAGGAKGQPAKPVKRLWLQSMTPAAIREGFERLRSDKQMHGLADAARSRSEADWLVGINGTRAMTAFNSRDGGFFLTTVGRVQTPTLSIVVEREEKIRAHVSRPYWEVRATFDAQAGQYDGKWFKSPESRDRYIAFIENGGSSGSFPEGFAEPTSFSSPEARQRFLDGQAYYATIGGWVELLKAKDYVAADRYFRAMPDWMKEKYYAKHPDQRAKAELDSEALRRGAEYFLAQGDDKLAILAKFPQLRQWLLDNGGDEGAMRGLVQSMYRAIPSSEPWLKRTFRERFPEIFSQEAAGERRLEGVARDLAANPDMLPFFERALKLQSSLFLEQLKHSKTPPKPWTIERKRRVHQKGKRRAARMSAHWSLHNDIRRSR